MQICAEIIVDYADTVSCIVVDHADTAVTLTTSTHTRTDYAESSENFESSSQILKKQSGEKSM